MNQHGMLAWSDLGRGLITLARKGRPAVRTVIDLVRHGDDDRMSLGRLLEQVAARHPRRIAIKDGDESITYEALDRRVNRIANRLIASGLAPGQSVAVLMDSRLALLAVVAAVAKAGGVAGMINTQQRQRALLHSLGCITPAIIVVGEELVDAIEEVRPSLGAGVPLIMVRDRGERPAPHGYIDLDHAAAGVSPHSPATTARVRAGAPCFYIFTSGTTGLPKASIMSHLRWLKAGTVAGNACLALDPGDTLYAPLPLYHNQALTVGWSSAMARGAALAIRRKFSAGAFWDDCRRYDARAFVYIGEVPRYLLNQPSSPAERAHAVRKAIGVGLRPELWRPFKERFGVDELYELYAASELNVGFFNVMNLDETVGFCPMRWALVAFDVAAGEPVRGANGRFVRVRKGEVGLLITRVSKRFRFEGYTDTRATERKLFRDVFATGDEWVNSGDLMRDIGFGHLQFVDRVGDTFRWKSENVSTTEVELVLHAFEGIAEATVYGVEVPGMPGRAGMAAVVPREATTIDLAALLAHARRELPAYAIPVFVRISGAIQTTGTFKHRKAELRAQGYDPAAISDPVYTCLPDGDGYSPLTPALYADIVAERVRL